ncbi:hypothetical protein [Halodurantibacterium flavum]|uniref:HK97 gp10 family phage protein n=1 Tax=Halodurantibacterium flavum TaxID=1382802 RepID=A0ABW4S8R7_9RHOB
MFQMSIDPRDLQAGLTDVERRQVPQATVWALNHTAKDVLEHMQRRMEVVFDRPTPFTKNAFHVWRATRQTMTATVQERPSVGRRHFLKVQEAGGRRPGTGLERLLQNRLKYSGQIVAAVPAAGARLDGRGNWSSGQRNQVLSAIQAQGDRSANTTAASRKRNPKRTGFFVPRPGSKLSKGVWQRDGRQRIRKVLHFTAAMPAYTRRLGFFEGAREVYARSFPMHFRRAFQRAMATRRR